MQRHNKTLINKDYDQSVTLIFESTHQMKQNAILDRMQMMNTKTSSFHFLPVNGLSFSPVLHPSHCHPKKKNKMLSTDNEGTYDEGEKRCIQIIPAF